MSDVQDPLPLRVHGRFEDDRYWKAHNQKIGNDITRTHRDELSIAFPTFGSRVWDYLPVVAEWLAFSQC